jgi:hypothetical protein
MQTDVKPDDVPPPPLAVAYYADATPPMLPVVRGIGVLCILFGFLGIGFLICQSTLDSYRDPARGFYNEHFFRLNIIAGYCFSLIFSVGYIIAGCGCLRRRPSGRRLLLGCAWGVLLWGIYGVGLSIWSYVKTWGGRYPTTELAAIIGYQLKYLISGAGFPLILILLMRNREVRRIFDDPAAD